MQKLTLREFFRIHCVQDWQSQSKVIGLCGEDAMQTSAGYTHGRTPAEIKKGKKGKVQGIILAERFETGKGSLRYVVSGKRPQELLLSSLLLAENGYEHGYAAGGGFGQKDAQEKRPLHRPVNGFKPEPEKM